jgi:hypothetical protein
MVGNAVKSKLGFEVTAKAVGNAVKSAAEASAEVAARSALTKFSEKAAKNIVKESAEALGKEAAERVVKSAGKTALGALKTAASVGVAIGDIALDVMIDDPFWDNPWVAWTIGLVLPTGLFQGIGRSLGLNKWAWE